MRRKTLRDAYASMMDDSQPIPPTGCILFAGLWTEKGYGSVSVSGKMMRAHRVSYLVNHGEIPLGLSVLHKCDVRCCINPRHLYVGTQLQNMADCSRRGRKAMGLANGKCKYPDAVVREMRRMRSCGASFAEISEAFDAPRTTVYGIVAKKRRVRAGH